MKAMERIIYDNYDFDELCEEAISLILDREEYSSADEIPESVLYDEMNAIDELNREISMDELDNFFSGNKWLLKGTIGRWDGPAEGGFIFSSVSEMSRAWVECDYLRIYDVNGHMYIDCAHHDGNNHFEIKKLTEKGEDYADRHRMDPDRLIHESLWNNGTRTHLPQFAHKVYGCKVREYQTDCGKE